MSLPVPADLPPLREGATVHVESALLWCRWGTVIRAHPDHGTGHGVVYELRMDDGSWVTAHSDALCHIYALPVPAHCRGRWDFHPPPPGVS